jgi:hypothetical protein
MRGEKVGAIYGKKSGKGEAEVATQLLDLFVSFWNYSGG